MGGEDEGMIPRSVNRIFAEIQRLREGGWAFEVQCSMLEIYNEALFDLLVRPGGDAPTALEPERPGAELPLRRVRVGDAASVHALLRSAARRRRVAATACNDRSSRSHAIFQLSLVGSLEAEGEVRSVEGLLSFVDLAGSERQANTQVAKNSTDNN